MVNKIAYITDVHIDEAFPRNLGIDTRKNWELVLEDVKRRGIKEIILGGDIGEPETNQWFFETIAEFDLSISLGNHDEYQEVIKYFKHQSLNDQNELYYTIEKDDFRRVYLDSSAGSISENQFHWLQKQLTTDKKLILFIHHAIFPVNTAIDRKHSLKGRQKIQQLLIESGKEVIVFCGHYHMEDHYKTEKINQYISPAVSYQVVKSEDPIGVTNDFFGYRIITLERDVLKTELVHLVV